MISGQVRFKPKKSNYLSVAEVFTTKINRIVTALKNERIIWNYSPEVERHTTTCQKLPLASAYASPEPFPTGIQAVLVKKKAFSFNAAGTLMAVYDNSPAFRRNGQIM